MSEGDSRRSSQWWRDVERHVADAEAAYADDEERGAGTEGEDGEDGLPDPWADVAVGTATLTPEQEALLAGPDDQPPTLRFAGAGASDDVPADRPGEGDEGGGLTDDQPPRPRLGS